MQENTFYPRFVEHRLTEALEDSPVVLIQGPRQCGKTTLAQYVCAPEQLNWRGGTATGQNRQLSAWNREQRAYTYMSFDDNVLRTSAEFDPNGFVADLPERVILDEVQRIPSIFPALKMEIDRRRLPGRFVLTGSSNVLLAPKIHDSLAGRLEIVRLHPLTQGEIEGGKPDGFRLGAPSTFLDALFGNGFKNQRIERLRAALSERITAGGYPAALARSTSRRRAAWHRNYLDALVQRDVMDMARIRNLDVLPRLLKLAASQTSSLFNISSLSAPFQISHPTIRDYVTLLERSFLLERLPPWHVNQMKRLIKTPKLHIGDTGLACALLDVDASAVAENRPLLGQLLETFVFQELRRQAGWRDSPTAFFHYRDKDKAEVDIVIEQGAHAVAGIEVKAAATVTSADFRGLRKLAKAAGTRFAGGVVLYDGEICAGFGNRLHAVPLRLLWNSGRNL